MHMKTTIWPKTEVISADLSVFSLYSSDLFSTLPGCFQIDLFLNSVRLPNSVLVVFLCATAWKLPPGSKLGQL